MRAKMKSVPRARRTSVAEVTHVSATGFWLLLDDREVCLPFKTFPWFKHATIGRLLNVEWPSERHLYWPDLDVDLAVGSIDPPDRFPLVSAAPLAPRAVAPLGAGGMGEVYRATDPRLGRDVAIKVLPESMRADPDRVARFEREARLFASINHPNM